MQKSFFFLSPVEVVKVTSSNLEEVAEWCGGKVAETESRRVPGRMDKYVWVPTPKGTSISWAFPGMYITKRLVRTVKDEIRVTFAVFRKDYFDKNYFDTPNQAVDETWERHAKQEKAKQKVAPKPTAPKNHLEGTSMEAYVPSDVQSETEPVTDEQIDALHGKGAAEALNAAIADGSIFNDNSVAEVDEVAAVAEAAIETEEKLLLDDREEVLT